MYALLDSSLPFRAPSKRTPAPRTATKGMFKRWTELLFKAQYGAESEVNPSAMSALMEFRLPERSMPYTSQVWLQGEGTPPASLMRYRALYAGQSLGQLEDRYLSSLHEVQEGWAVGNKTRMVEAFRSVVSLLEAHLAYHAAQFEDHEQRHLLPIALMVAHADLYRHPVLLEETLALCNYFPVLRSNVATLQKEQQKGLPFDRSTWLPVPDGAVSLLRGYRVKGLGKPLFELHETYHRHLRIAQQARLNKRPCDAFQALSSLLPLVEAELAYVALNQEEPADLSWELSELAELCVLQEKTDVLLDLNLIVQSFAPLQNVRSRVEGAWIMREVVHTLRERFPLNQIHGVEEAMLCFAQEERKWVEHAFRILKRCDHIEFQTVSHSNGATGKAQNAFQFLK